MDNRLFWNWTALAALGLVLLTAPWSLPALVGLGILPRGFYLLLLVPLAIIVGFVYLTAVCWRYLLAARAIPLTSPSGIGFGLGIVSVLGAVIIAIWIVFSVVPSLRVLINEGAFVLPLLAILVWYPVGDMLASGRWLIGGILLCIPLVIAGIGVLSVGIIGIWMIVYIVGYVVLGLPVFLLGFERVPSPWNGQGTPLPR